LFGGKLMGRKIKWDRERRYSYVDVSVDFGKLYNELKGYLGKMGYRIVSEESPSVNGFKMVGEKASRVKISRQPQLAVEVVGSPNSFECVVLAYEGKKLTLDASRWNLKVVETIEQLKNSGESTAKKTCGQTPPDRQAAASIATHEFEVKPISIVLKKPFMRRKEYYQELGGILLQIIESMGDKEVIMLRTIQTRLRAYAPNVEATTEDIEKALKMLKERGLILGVRTLPGGLKIIELTPLELTEELTTILKLTEKQEYTTIEEVARNTGWPLAKVEQALNRLEKLGITRRVENYKNGTRYYFP
jgi:hypothetical protein